MKRKTAITALNNADCRYCRPVVKDGYKMYQVDINSLVPNPTACVVIQINALTIAFMNPILLHLISYDREVICDNLWQ